MLLFAWVPSSELTYMPVTVSTQMGPARCFHSHILKTRRDGWGGGQTERDNSPGEGRAEASVHVGGKSSVSPRRRPNKVA